jgi:hypothetical protein
MKRSELEHVIRAAATIAEDDEIVVIGSQAILGQFPDEPHRSSTHQRLIKLDAEPIATT